VKGFDPRLAVLTAESGLARITSDTIAAFRFSSVAQRRFAEAFHKFREVYLRAGNQAGKTHVAAHYFVALMRGVKQLDGVDMPLLGTPVNGLVLAQGREMAKESVIRSVLRAIGSHPHHEEKAANSIIALWVKPDTSRSDDWHDWSVMRFFVEDGQSVEGMRLDFAWADEPPKWFLWGRLRTRGKANRPYLRAITATPIDILTWRPLRDNFIGCKWPNGKDGKVEIRLSVYDNKALSQEHLKNIEEDAKGPWKDAILTGEYVNAAGANPFDKDGLKRWLARCVPGKSVSGLTASGLPYTYETWGEREDGEGYFVVADPCAGIEDEQHEHDPGGYWVTTRSIPYTVVERYVGYLPSRDLGWLAAQRASHYNRAMLAWEHNSGYGESFWEGSGHYSNPYVEMHGDRRHLSLSERIGWLTTATTRGTLIGALQKAIVQDGITLYSLDAVESLGSVVLKRDGLRPEAKSGAHDEDMIIGGLTCHMLETIPWYPPPREKGSVQLARELGFRLAQEPDDPDPFQTSW